MFAAFFALMSVYNRLDFTITKDEKWQESQDKDKAVGIVQQLVSLWDGKAGSRLMARLLLTCFAM